MDEDIQREIEIDRAYAGLLGAPTEGLKQAYFERMRGLIARRSAEQIERMEREKGLR